MYLKRRDNLRKRFGSNRAKGYADAVKIIRRKIEICRKQIKRIDKRNEQISELVKSINKFFGVDIKSKKRDSQHSIARNCYYKYGIEKGFEGSKLSVFIGRSKISAHRQRRRFTRSFKTNKEHQKQYHNFLNFQLP